MAARLRSRTAPFFSAEPAQMSSNDFAHFSSWLMGLLADRLPASLVAEIAERLHGLGGTGGAPATHYSSEDLERRNLLRVLDYHRTVAARSVTGSELQAATGISRQRLQQLRDEGRLLGLKLPYQRELHYPTWQFTADGTPHEALPTLLAAASEAHLSPLGLDSLLIAPWSPDTTETLADRLRRGDVTTLLRAIAATAEQGS